MIEEYDKVIREYVAKERDGDVLVMVRPFPQVTHDFYHVLTYVLEHERHPRARTWEEIAHEPNGLGHDKKTVSDWLKFHRDWYKHRMI